MAKRRIAKRLKRGPLPVEPSVSVSQVEASPADWEEERAPAQPSYPDPSEEAWVEVNPPQAARPDWQEELEVPGPVGPPPGYDAALGFEEAEPEGAWGYGEVPNPPRYLLPEPDTTRWAVLPHQRGPNYYNNWADRREEEDPEVGWGEYDGPSPLDVLPLANHWRPVRLRPTPRQPGEGRGAYRRRREEEKIWHRERFMEAERMAEGMRQEDAKTVDEIFQERYPHPVCPLQPRFRE